MKNQTRQTLGKWGENVAANYLQEQGFSLLARNYRSTYGEIDLIAQMGSLIVFVEVKTRSTNTFGPPEVSVTRRKQRHLVSAAQAYMQENPLTNIDWRIDVITVQCQHPEQPPVITHFENAVS